MSVITPRTTHRVRTVPELIDALDLEDHQEEIESQVENGSLLTEPLIHDALNRADGAFLWNYSHEEYQDVEVTIYELPVTWETVAGVPYEDIKHLSECPECGHDRFNAEMSEKRTGTVQADDFAMVDMETTDHRYSQLDCQNCGHSIIDDGEFAN